MSTIETLISSILVIFNIGMAIYVIYVTLKKKDDEVKE